MKRLITGALALVLLLAGCSSVPTVPVSQLPATVSVSEVGDAYVLLPRATALKAVGLVFYPGGFVQPAAYLKSLVPLAEAGYPVVVVKMPFDLAFFGADRGLAARQAVPAVKRWAIGGHSLGGVASAIVVSQHPDAFAGIVFWASYPAKDNSLKALSLPALQITGSLDGLSTPAKVAEAADFLPPDTTKVVIEGGNHAQFADYGPQKGDGTATIAREEQQTLASKAVLAFLARLE